MRLSKAVSLVFVWACLVQVCYSYLPSIRKPPSPPSAEELDKDPKKRMWNKVVQISPDGKSEFMKVALRESISGKMCKFPAAYRDKIAWDCMKDSCPVELKPGEQPTKPSFQIQSQTWEKCSRNYKSENFWQTHQEEYLEWAEQQQFYRVDQIYSNGSWIYLPVAQRNSVNSSQQCVLPSVGYGSKSKDVLTDCQRLYGSYQCQVVVVEDIVKPTRLRRSVENKEKLVWRECEMEIQTSQPLQDSQISTINGDDNNNNFIQKQVQQLLQTNQQYISNVKQQQQKQRGKFNLWWIVPITAVFGIFLVALVWWTNKPSKKGQIRENLDNTLDEQQNLVQNNDDNFQVLEDQVVSKNEPENEEIDQEKDQQIQSQQQNSINLVREQELVKLGS